MLELCRYNYLDLLTQGILFYGDKFLADTLELPWKGNAQFLSCIPEGTYDIEWKQTGHKWPCYEVKNVPNREAILIHPANEVMELEGCISLGVKYGKTLWFSAHTLVDVHEAVGDKAQLIITKVPE